MLAVVLAAALVGAADPEAAVRRLGGKVVRGTLGPTDPLPLDQQTKKFPPTGDGPAVVGVDLGGRPGVSSDLIARLASFPDLQFVRLAGCPAVTDETVPLLAKLRRLQVLDLSECPLTGASLGELAGCPDLHTLNLRRCEKLSAAAFPAVARVRSLRSLDASRDAATDDTAVAAVTPLDKLEYLCLASCPVTDSGLRSAAGHARLRQLNVRDNDRITDTGLADVARLGRLQKLVLKGCPRLSDAGLSHLGRLPALSSLDLEECPRVTDAGLKALAPLAGRLTKLSLKDCPRVSDVGLHELARFTRLEKLYLDGSGVTPAGVARERSARRNCVVTPAAPPARPNVLFVMADDLNCDLGCYGDKLAKTPHLDRLAAKGVRFDWAYCQFPVCNPSRASMLSGLRPDATGVHDLVTPTRARLKDAVFLPQAFRSAGYRTVKFGKIFHADLGSRDTFEDPASWDEDEREGKDAKNPPKEMVAEAFEAARAMRLNCDDATAHDGRIARRAAERMAGLAADGIPFFLAVGFRRPHAPYVAPSKYWDIYDPATLISPAEPDHVAGIPKPALTRDAEKKKLTVEDWRHVRHGYRAAVSYLDAQVGVLLDALDRLKLWENTVVVFVSDHGYHLGEHGGLWHKMTLFEESARVPLVVAAPGVRPAAARGLVELIDLYPTLGELCRVSVPGGLAGASFVPLLVDPVRPGKPAAYTQLTRFSGKDDPKPVVTGRSVRTDRWRYTEWDGGTAGAELYDHAADSREYRNLAANPGWARVLSNMKVELARGRVVSDAVPGPR